MDHHLASATGGEGGAVGIGQLSGGQRTLLSLALILAVRGFCSRLLDIVGSSMGVACRMSAMVMMPWLP